LIVFINDVIMLEKIINNRETKTYNVSALILLASCVIKSFYDRNK